MIKKIIVSFLIFSPLIFASEGAKTGDKSANLLKPQAPNPNEMRDESMCLQTYRIFRHQYKYHSKSCWLDRCCFEITAPCMALCCPWIRENMCQGNCEESKKNK